MGSTHLYGCGLTINVRWPLCCVAMERVLCWVAIEWVVQLVEDIGRRWCLRNTCGYDSWITELRRVVRIRISNQCFYMVTILTGGCCCYNCQFIALRRNKVCSVGVNVLWETCNCSKKKEIYSWLIETHFGFELKICICNSMVCCGIWD